MSEEPKEHIPFREGLFVQEAGNAYLVGNRCKDCGQVFFPSRAFCFQCSSQRMETIKLGRRGQLYSFSTSHMPSTHFLPPYTVGWIDLAEGIRIFSPIKDTEGQELQIGMEMGLVIDELWQEGDRRIVGYKYRPIS
jgi:uncharacterized OB-fold protein